jgi:ribonuclease Z
MNHASPLREGHPFRQWRTWTAPGSGLTLTGYSRANDKTFFHVPRLRLGLDAGLVEGIRPETVLLTHAHLDHVKDLDYLATRPGGVDLYVPAEVESYVRAYLRATTEVNQAAAFDPALAADARVHGVRPGDEFTFGRRGEHVARVVACRHKVPCVGYVVSSRHRELDPAVAGLRDTMSGPDFGRLMAARRAAGEPVDREVHRPLFAYVGDTHPTALSTADWLAGVPVVVTECTFLDDAELDRAERTGHTVWSRLRPIIAAHPQTLFVLIHFSLRHSDAEVVTFFEKELADGGPPNIVIWAGTDGLLPQQHGI